MAFLAGRNAMKYDLRIVDFNYYANPCFRIIFVDSLVSVDEHYV